ncbi:MAG TPA: DUF6295 family protein [Mycobacterium sp.]
MCTTIGNKVAVTGSGKGANGWFHVDEADAYEGDGP